MIQRNRQMENKDSTGTCLAQAQFGYMPGHRVGMGMDTGTGTGTGTDKGTDTDVHRHRHRHRQGHGWTTLGGVGRDTRGSERDNRTIERWAQGIACRSTPVLKMYLHSSSAT